MADTLERAACTFTRTATPIYHAVLDHVSWATYEALLADHLDSPWPRFVYDDGVLEIMTPSLKHDRIAVRAQKFIDVLAEEWRLTIDNIGHATLRNRQVGKGFEADASIYLRNASRVREKDNLDLAVDPPPDLVVEIEVTRSALEKLALYAKLGVPEVWRCDDSAATFHILQGNAYVESSTSIAFPGVTTQLLAAFLSQTPPLQLSEWLNPLREWARAHRPAR